MPDAISNTSPLLYLLRAQALEWLPVLFGEVWTTTAVITELRDGKLKGHEVPSPESLPWLTVVNPQSTPSEWLSLELGARELSTLALALENPRRVVLLDDARARRTAEAAGLPVWGTLRILLEAKSAGLTDRIAPYVDRLTEKGLWMSAEIRGRVLALAGEEPSE